MNPAFDLPGEDLAILLGVLRDHLPAEVKVWVFGSRVTGAARRYSDLDLALQGAEPLGLEMLGGLQDAPSESDLTIKVDLVDLRMVDRAYRRNIEGEMVPLPLFTELR